MNVNFRKLSKGSLTKLLKYYGVDETKVKNQADLAALVARIFDNTFPIENQTVEKFADMHCHADADTSSVLKKRTYSSREQLDSEPAMIGEQVAAKVKQSLEEICWILGNVIDYNSTTKTYEIQDEDDVCRVMTMRETEVKRLDDSSNHLRRGDSVLAVFPETTSFYRAIVVKNPKPSATGFRDDVVVKFKDDEDNNGKNPARKVPARFVLRRSDVGDEGNDSDEEED